MIISQTARNIGQTLLLPTNRKSRLAFRLVHFHLTLATLKVKVEVMRISTENISQTATDGKTLLLPTQQVACGLSNGIFIFDLGNLNVNIMHISTVNISQMVTIEI